MRDLESCLGERICGYLEQVERVYATAVRSLVRNLEGALHAASENHWVPQWSESPYVHGASFVVMPELDEGVFETRLLRQTRYPGVSIDDEGFDAFVEESIERNPDGMRFIAAGKLVGRGLVDGWYAPLRRIGRELTGVDCAHSFDAFLNRLYSVLRRPNEGIGSRTTMAVGNALGHEDTIVVQQTIPHSRYTFEGMTIDGALAEINPLMMGRIVHFSRAGPLRALTVEILDTHEHALALLRYDDGMEKEYPVGLVERTFRHDPSQYRVEIVPSKTPGGRDVVDPSRFCLSARF